MRKLIIDADTGSDDAVALILAYRNLEKNQILGVSVVSGNVPLQQAALNTRYVNELCEINIPIYKGESKPLTREYKEVFTSSQANQIALSYKNLSTSAQHVHGIDGLGDIGLIPEEKKFETETAQEFYTKALTENESIDLVTLGPLTNIALMLENNPKLLHKIKHCYIMGGSSNALGNVTKFAEYNFWVDPEAADKVLNSGIPITMIGWDPSLYDAMIDNRKIVEIEKLNTKYSKFTNDIQVVLRQMMKEIFGEDSYDLPDPLAMAVYLDQTIISQAIEVNVRVDTRDGMTRGGCILDFLNLEPNSHKIRVVQRCHQEKFFDLLKKSLS
ncbi:MAG: nucleoside hydrolase [Actinomycetota bacterium]|nr:nucleoside hydrolase [Actinomycetota bacterium]